MLPRWTLLFLLWTMSQVSLAVDRTREAGAIGEDVVIETVQYLRNKGIIGKGHNFLIKLAFVETDFGRNITKPNATGIWQFTEEEFKATRRVKETGSLFRNINDRLKIQWRKDVNFTDLRKPLYAALAVHLYLTQYLVNTTDYPNSLEAQAKLRETYYTPRLKTIDRTQFQQIIRAKESEKVSCKMDLVVLLDGSTSINPEDFTTAKTFLANFFAEISNHGKNRFGLVLYSDDSHIIIRLDSDKSGEMNKTIKEIEHPDGQTYTNHGLRTTLEVFGASPHPGVKKALVIITDGDSTDGVSEIHNVLKEKIIPFAVGVGIEVRQSELLELAGGDKIRVHSLEKYTQLMENIIPLYTDLCLSAQLVNEGVEYTETIGVGQKHIYQFNFVAEKRKLDIFTRDTPKKTNVTNAVVIPTNDISQPKMSQNETKIEINRTTVQIWYKADSSNSKACVSICEPISTCEKNDLELRPGLNIIEVPLNCSNNQDRGASGTLSRGKRDAEPDFDEKIYNFYDYYSEIEEPAEVIPESGTAAMVKSSVYVVVMQKPGTDKKFNLTKIEFNLTFYETKLDTEKIENNTEVHLFTRPPPSPKATSSDDSRPTYKYEDLGIIIVTEENLLPKEIIWPTTFIIVISLISVLTAILIGLSIFICVRKQNRQTPTTRPEILELLR